MIQKLGNDKEYITCRTEDSGSESFSWEDEDEEAEGMRWISMSLGTLI